MINFKNTINTYRRFTKVGLHQQYFEVSKLEEEAIKTMFELRKPKPGDIFLDIGCGAGKDCIYVQQKFAVLSIGVDLCKEMLETGREYFSEDWYRSCWIEGDALSLPFPNGRISYAFSNSMLPHLDPNSQERFLGEVRRILNCKGIFCLITQNASYPRHIRDSICTLLKRRTPTNPLITLYANWDGREWYFPSPFYLLKIFTKYFKILWTRNFPFGRWVAIIGAKL